MASVTVSTGGATTPTLFAPTGFFVRFNPNLTPQTGSVNATLLLCAMEFHARLHAGSDGSFSFTEPQITAATSLTRSEQIGARKKLIENGLITEQYGGIPRRLFYRFTEKGLVLLNSAKAEDPGPNQGGNGGEKTEPEPASKDAGFTDTGDGETRAPEYGYYAQQSADSADASKRVGESEAKKKLRAKNGKFASQPGRDAALAPPVVSPSVIEAPTAAAYRPYAPAPRRSVPTPAPGSTPARLDYPALKARYDALDAAERARLLEEAKERVPDFCWPRLESLESASSCSLWELVARDYPD